MSIAFSQFTNNAATRGNAADTIARGLNVPIWPAGAMGVGKQPTNVVNRGGMVIPAMVIPAGIGPQLANIAARWANLNEAERRVRIDAYLMNIAVNAGVPGGPAMWLERGIGAGGIGAAPGGALFPLGAQIGNGPLDYIWSNPFFGQPSWVRSVAIEAKRDLGFAGDRGQWQLTAQMATSRQVGLFNPRRVRGILTDGQQWRFYQLDCDTGVLDRTPVLNTGIPLQQNFIIRLTYKFLRYVNVGVDIWPAP